MTLVTPINSKALVKVHRLNWVYINDTLFKEILKIPDVSIFLCLYKNKMTFSWLLAENTEIILKCFAGFCCPWLKEKRSPSCYRTLSDTTQGGAPWSSTAPSSPRQPTNPCQRGWKLLTQNSPHWSISILHKQDQSCTAHYQTAGIWTCWLDFFWRFFLVPSIVSGRWGTAGSFESSSPCITATVNK